MNQLYNDVFLGIDGIVYARRNRYNLLSRTSESPDYYTPIPDAIIPSLKELLWVNNDTYIGITTDGDLYSFESDTLVNLESPVKKGYVTGTTNNQLLVLLEDGRVRIIYVEGDGSLTNINGGVTDIIVTQHIVNLWATDRHISPNLDEETVVNYISTFIAITSDNEFLYLAVMHTAPHYDDNNYQYTAIVSVNRSYTSIVNNRYEPVHIDNSHHLEHQDIKTIRGGRILMNDGSLYTIDRYNHNRYALVRSEVEGIDDIFNIIDQSPALLSKDGRIYIGNTYVAGIDDILPTKFMYYYIINEWGYITYMSDIIVVQAANGGIYNISSGASIEMIAPNPALSSVRDMTTKSARWIESSN